MSLFEKINKDVDVGYIWTVSQNTVNVIFSFLAAVLSPEDFQSIEMKIFNLWTLQLWTMKNKVSGQCRVEWVWIIWIIIFIYYLEWDALTIHICVYVLTSRKDMKHVHFKQPMSLIEVLADPTSQVWTRSCKKFKWILTFSHSSIRGRFSLSNWPWHIKKHPGFLNFIICGIIKL